MASSSGGIGDYAGLDSVPPQKTEEEDELGPLATYSDVFTAFGNTTKIKIFRIVAVLFSIVSGLAFPAMAYYFAQVFQDIGSVDTAEDFSRSIRKIVFTFMIIG